MAGGGVQNISLADGGSGELNRERGEKGEVTDFKFDAPRGDRETL